VQIETHQFPPLAASLFQEAFTALVQAENHDLLLIGHIRPKSSKISKTTSRTPMMPLGP
jgi:hypothetical protein